MCFSKQTFCYFDLCLHSTSTPTTVFTWKKYFPTLHSSAHFCLKAKMWLIPLNKNLEETILLLCIFLETSYCFAKTFISSAAAPACCHTAGWLSFLSSSRCLIAAFQYNDKKAYNTEEMILNMVKLRCTHFIITSISVNDVTKWKGER